MIACQQKYCANCIKPVFRESGEFSFGYCKASRNKILFTNAEETKLYDVQPLYCYEYKPRKRKINY